MYTLLELQSKTLTALKQIGDELNVLPEGDRRYRQSWIDAIAGVNPPLLALLEVSPAGEVQAQKPIIEMVENAPGVEVEPVQTPKFGRIVYPKPAAKPIAHEEARPQLDRVQSADVHNLGSHPTKSGRDSSDAKTEALVRQEGDRVLAVARHCETGRGRVLPDQSTKLVNFTEADRLENEPRMSQSAIGQAAENSPGVEVNRVPEPIEYPRNSRRDCPCCGGIQSLYQSRNFVMESWVIRCLYCDYERLKDPRCAYLAAPEPVHGPDEYPWKKEAILQAIAYPPPPPGYTPTRDHCSPLLPIAPSTQTFSGVDSSQELIDIQRQELIVQEAQNAPGVEVDDVEDILPDCVVCFGEKFIEDTSGRILNCSHCTEARVSQSAIGPVPENSPGVEVDQVQNLIVSVAKTSTAKVSSSKKVKKANSYLDCPSCGVGRLRVKQSIYWETSCTKCGYFVESILYPFTPADTGYKVGDWVKVRIKPRLATICRGEVVCIDKVCDDYLRFVNPNLNPALVLWARQQLLHPHEVSPCEPPVVKAAENSPAVKPDPKPDRNPILTGIPLSNRFIARYSPPQSETLQYELTDGYKKDADGQLSLFAVQAVTEPEPPDPDDFESLDAFREVIARWDGEHPDSFDHCSDFPSSVHCEPLEVSLDSFCEWAPCPADFRGRQRG